VYVSHGKAAQQSGLLASHQNSQEIMLVFSLEQLIQLFCLKLIALKEQLSQKTYTRTIERVASTKNLELILCLC
jgi:hypothetical protein